MNIQTAINELARGNDLSGDDMQAVMGEIMQGDATAAQIAGFLIALRMKGETVTEIAAAASVMRDFATRVHVEDDNMVDIVGTGGDGSRTFNISTTSAFVIAAAGAKVAKHNNRSISSSSGSADVLEQAGIKMGLQPENVARCINEVGIGFMFAQAHHPATRHAAVPRKELATRTIFNLLGPLTNPAWVKRQLVGVYNVDLIRPVAEVLQKMGSTHTVVVHSSDGLDEISISKPTHVAELKENTISEYEIAPGDFGISTGNTEDFTVDNPEQSLQVMMSVLNNEPGTAKDVVLLNAGTGIYVAGLCNDIQSGIECAVEMIESGKALEKVQQLAALSVALE